MKITYAILFLAPLLILLYCILGLPFKTLLEEEESVEVEAESTD